MINTKRLLAGAVALMVTSSVFAAATTTTTTTTTPAPTATATAQKSLEAPANVKIVSKTNTSVTLEWDKVSGATSYVVKYDKKSVATSKDTLAQYNEESDTVYGTGKVIEKLTPDTMYYFAVVSLDDKMLESEKFSTEVSIKTDAAAGVAASGAVAAPVTTGTATTVAPAPTAPKGPALAISRVGVTNSKNITVLFNNDLSADPVTLKVRNTKDNSDVAVASAMVDSMNKKQVNVVLGASLDPNAAYSVTVLSAKDVNGTNIQNGVDGIKDFTTLATLALAPEAMTASGATGTGVTGTGAVATELPKTGTQENLIIIASLLIAGAMVYVYRARKA